MATKKKASRRRRRRLRVGDKISLTFVGRRRVARVIEDRGDIGVGGRQLIRIIDLGPGAEYREPYEVPAEYVTLLNPPRRKPRTTKAKAA